MIDKLNERLTIEKSKAYTDKAGNHRNTWEDYFSCFTYASTYELQESGDEVKQENRSVEEKIEKAMADFDYAANRFCLDTAPGRIMYFYYDPARYFKYIRPIKRK